MENLPPYLNPANHTPRANPPKPEPALQPATAVFPLNPDQLAKLSKEELIALIKRCTGYEWGVGMLTEDEILDGMMHQLAVRGLDPKGRETLSAINQYIDRKKGKAVTPVALGIRDMRDMKGSITVQFVKP